MHSKVRYGGLLVGAAVFAAVGAVSLAYAILLFYIGSPATATSMARLEPLNRVVFAVATNPMFDGVALVGVSVFLWDVNRNGLHNFDDRTYFERKRDMRRKWAETRDAWQPPEEDINGPTMYDELREQVEDGGLAVKTVEKGVDGDASVRGVVHNQTNEWYENVRAAVRFVLDDGTQTEVATKRKLGPQSRWKFEVFNTVEGDVHDVEIVGVDGETVDR